MARPLIIAHRGASAEAPENTLAAFDRALARGADGIELDVRMTRDGVPVVFHDATLTRLAGRRRRVATLTHADLHSVRIHGQTIPTLADVLDLIGDRAAAQIELKAGTSVTAVVRVIREARTPANVILASFAGSLVRAARQLAPGVPRMLISDRGSPPAVASALNRLDAMGVSLDHHAIRSPDLIAYLHARHRRVWSWTINDPAIMLRLAAWNIDAMISDDPALLRSTLRSTAR